MASKQPSEDIPEVIPVSGKRRRRVCPHCGSDDIAKGLQLTTAGGDVGLKVDAGRVLGIRVADAELLRVDLCLACGTVIRIYVKNTDRKWG